jgi:hypothetical protein
MQIILVLHNILRWAVLLFGLWTIFSAMSGIVSKRNYTAADSRSNFFFMLSCDIQFLLGMVLYFTNSWFNTLKTPGTMKDAYNRFFSLEHGLLMIIALILVHVGRVSVKKATTPAAKHKRTLLFFGLAIVLILAAIPWPFREAIARPLLRGFN